jgi:hypothetical protein
MIQQAEFENGVEKARMLVFLDKETAKAMIDDRIKVKEKPSAQE